MTTTAIADFETLSKLVASKRPNVVKAWLARNRVHYFIDSKGHPVTTLAALDRALNRGAKQDDGLNIEALIPCPSSPAKSPSQGSPKKADATTKSSRTSGTNSPESTKD